ncbi:4-hydroxy-tetrahydrodipicolinate synthase [Patescibacteria group bacterium]|nr:4-hydroxy-tetrahydrodipicolinate synthase [Patescibacteria group bacterium]
MKKCNVGHLFGGAGTALITPFNNDTRGGSLQLEPLIDFKALEWLVEEQIKAGINFLVPAGTTGEAPCLNPSEQIDVIKCVVKTTNGRVPILAGTGSNSTREAVELTIRAKDVGANGALVVSPYYNKPMLAGMRHYFESVASVGLPIILYDIPGRTAKGVPTQLIIDLANDGIIAGIKWASGDLIQLEEILKNTPSTFTVLSGDDGKTLDLLKMCGHGVISVVSHIIPRTIIKMVNAIIGVTPNKDLAQKIHTEISPLIEVMFIETNPVPVKTAMAFLHSNIKPIFRSPMCPLEPKSIEKLKQVLLYQLYNKDGTNKGN